MKFLKLILVVMSVFLFSGCASAASGVRVAADKKGDSLYAITVENKGKDSVKFSVSVEIREGGQWVEYPHRLEDGLLEPQRKIHSLKGGEVASFVLDVERDIRASPAIPSGAEGKRSIHVARIAVKQFSPDGEVQLITSDEFNLLVR